MFKIKSEEITEYFTHEFSVSIATETLPKVGTVKGRYKRVEEKEFKALQDEAQKATNGLLNIRRDADDEDAERVDIAAMDAVYDKINKEILVGIIGIEIDGKELSATEGKEWAFKNHPYSFKSVASDAFFAGYRGSKAKNAKK
jgi:hypothetical protein